jgi:hypothetical protein
MAGEGRPSTPCLRSTKVETGPNAKRSASSLSENKQDLSTLKNIANHGRHREANHGASRVRSPTARSAKAFLLASAASQQELQPQITQMNANAPSEMNRPMVS